MATWGLSVCLLVVFGSLALADSGVTFPENVRRGNRIVSGWEAKEGEIPYQLSLRMVRWDGRVSGCGGTIIHSEWGLTAAHCTATRVTIVVRTGTVNLTRPVDIFETTTYYNHPLYIEALPTVVQPHDIGLIKFNRVLKFSALVQPIRLQSSLDKNVNYNEIRLQASGWGLTWTAGPSPEKLNWVYLRGVSNHFCFIAFGGSSIVVDSTICARGYNVTSQSTCQGDSGGPLVKIDEDGLPTQIGISSFVSSTGCHTDFPAGFIRTGHYHNWFKLVTGYNFDHQVKPSTTTVKPKPEQTTTEEPEPETTTTAELEPETTTTAELEPETTTTAELEPETTTAAALEPETTTTAEPESETTTTVEPEQSTTDSEIETSTIEIPETETTTTQEPAPEQRSIFSRYFFYF